MKRYIILFIAFFICHTSLVAREVRALNDNWYFYTSSARSIDGALRVNLPYTWGAEGNATTIGNYVRKINIPSRWRNERIFIKFNGVNNSANLLFNGHHIGEHRGAYTAFTFELTDYVEWGKENELQLIVDASPSSSVPPISYDHQMEYGVHRGVELITTPKSAISPIYYGSDGVFVTTHEIASNRAKGDVRVMLSARESEPYTLRLSIFNESGDRVFRADQQDVSPEISEVVIPFELSSPKRWSTTTPTLYRFAVELVTPTTVDRVEVTSGLRTIAISDAGQILLNEQPTPIRGVVLYHDHPLVGNSLTQKELSGDLALIDELGANAIRSAVSPHPQALYELCNKNGVMVWIDFPLSRTTYMADIAYLPTEEFHRNAERLAHEIVAQNYNHPSVVAWGLFSQIKPQGASLMELLDTIYKSTKSFDATRVIGATSNQNGDLNKIPELVSWRQNLGWYRGNISDISLWRNNIHSKWGSFNSGVTYGESGSVSSQNRPQVTIDKSSQEGGTQLQLFDRSQPDWYPEGNMTKLHEEYSRVILPDPQFWGVWLCNMFDYRSTRNANGENNSGLVTHNRDIRKDIFYLYRSQWNKKTPTLHIAGKREWRRTKEVNGLVVYASSEESMTATLNGSTKLTATPLGVGQWLIEPFELRSGDNKIEVKQGRQSDSITLNYEEVL